MEGTLPQDWLVSLFETYDETHAFKRIACARSVPSEFVGAVYMIMNLNGDATNVDTVIAERDIRENIFEAIKPNQPHAESPGVSFEDDAVQESGTFRKSKGGSRGIRKIEIGSKSAPPPSRYVSAHDGIRRACDRQSEYVAGGRRSKEDV